MSDRIQTNYLGLVDFDAALQMQTSARDRLLARELDAVLLGLEHPAVITLGVRGHATADLQISESDLLAKGLQLRSIGRGGQATLHSPGQLVIYPCVNLRAYDLGARIFVELVQRTTQSWLGDLGINATSDSHEPGLFVAGEKIAAFGFQISNGLTSHGIAINVRNNLELFDLIRTCGVRGQRVTSLERQSFDSNQKHSLEALFLGWSARFRTNLESMAVDEAGTLPVL
ncbi:hypothetical protein BH10BDE1_BH10BDE1_14610 [soil metagenome]